jgi:hypothetical protein
MNARFERSKAALGVAGSTTVDASLPRTKADYDRLPAAEVRSRYLSEPAFKQAIDKLIQERKI